MLTRGKPESHPLPRESAAVTLAGGGPETQVPHEPTEVVPARGEPEVQPPC